MSYTKLISRTVFTAGICMVLSLAAMNSHAANGDPQTTTGQAVAESNEKDHQQPDRITNMDELMTRQPNPNVNVNGIGIYVYDGMYSLDAMGPYQVFKSAALKTFLIGKEKGTVKMSNGLVVAVEKSIDEVNQLDILLIPGGAFGAASQTAPENAKVLNWIQKIDQTSIYTTSVCTGAWILGAAGLLQDKEAVTHWYRAEEMLSKYGAEYQHKRWIRDGKYWTSAGVTAGIDMALALVNHLYGRQYTQAVMLDLEYDPKPPVKGGTPEKSDSIIAQLMKDMYDFYLINFVNCPLGTPGACLFN